MAIYEKQSNGAYKKISQIYAGRSAYDIAVDNGFEGTEAEWLASLKNAETFYVSVPVTGWSGGAPYSLTIPAPGVRADDRLLFDIALDVTDSAAAVADAIRSYNLIDKAVSENNIITLYCWSGTPIVPITLEVVAVHATEA